jgi:signal peptidase I
MSPTLTCGDYVLVNKLVYGARILTKSDDGKNGGFKSFRFKGFGKIRRNDVLVFNYPYQQDHTLQWDLTVYYVKRCIAVSGDTLWIDKGIYKVRSETGSLLFLNLKMDSVMANKVPNCCFPYNNANYSWTAAHFGPLYIPRKGDKIAIDTVNIVLYQNLITYETNKSITVKNGKVFLDNESVDYYIFSQNYYFMAGDSTPNSFDSRYWGLLPEDFIVGKAFIIWKSIDESTKKYRLERFFKKIM